MRVLVCGGREWDDRATLFRCMDRLAAVLKIDLVIEGEQRGADRLARIWALSRRLPYLPFKANWKRDGSAAGRIRNEAMLVVGTPDLVVAFPSPDSVGTWHMVKIAREAEVPVFVMPRDLAKVDALGEGVFA